jgi:hypothetical protein
MKQPQTTGMKDMAQKAIQANKDHQYALKVYTERLEAELQTVDKMLVCISHLARSENQCTTICLLDVSRHIGSGGRTRA